ncbi:MAG: DUF3108 domain-containing protein [Akkermansiaceae bacterium]|nr:DUF3108 domain-containing protein [Akkermansiaceae bacterium]
MKLPGLILCGCLALPFTDTAAAAPPEWAAELTSAAPGTHTPLPPCVIDMQLSWKGTVNSGKLRMEFAPKDVKKSGALVVRSSASSLGAAASLFPYQNNFWSELDPATFKPRFFHATESDRKETVTTTTRHFANRVECRENTRLLKSGKETSKDRSFTYSPVFDIFSAMLHIRSQKLAEGDRITLVVHPFDKPYLLRVKVLGRENHLGRATIRLKVGMRKINPLTMELMPYKKLKSDAILWLSDDKDRIPVEFRAAVFIGDVRATLSGFHKNQAARMLPNRNAVPHED